MRARKSARDDEEGDGRLTACSANVFACPVDAMPFVSAVSAVQGVEPSCCRPGDAVVKTPAWKRGSEEERLVLIAEV